MNIALVGYGKMGRAIEKVAIERGHAIALRIDIGNAADLNEASAAGIDAAIEFTGPDSAFGNVMRCLALGLPVVCGSTGWLDRYDLAVAECEARGGSLLYASNFSVGVNILFSLNRHLARLMTDRSEYSVGITEVHHTQKKDAPSGTALTLAEQIIAELPHLKGWVDGETDDKESLGIVSERRDPFPGLHRVSYRSAIDDIEIVHNAHSREGFALGAVIAAEYIARRKGVFGMSEVLGMG
jgi:4-hydroxy-tetrahydrodipicolinate reductase